MLAHHFYTMACNNAWANHRLLPACAALAPQDFVAPRTSFFPSIKATLNHILTVDWYYVDALERALRGEPPHAEPGASSTRRNRSTRAALSAAQHAVDRRLVALCAALTDADLERPIAVPRRAGIQDETATRLLAHLFQHQIHHRGQAHAMLAGTPVTPPQLDEFFCANEAHLRAAELAEIGLVGGRDLAPRPRLTSRVGTARRAHPPMRLKRCSGPACSCRRCRSTSSRARRAGRRTRVRSSSTAAATTRASSPPTPPRAMPACGPAAARGGAGARARPRAARPRRRRRAAALAQLATWALRFTPMRASRRPTAFVAEIGGSLRLFGGLRALVARLAHGVAGPRLRDAARHRTHAARRARRSPAPAAPIPSRRPTPSPRRSRRCRSRTSTSETRRADARRRRRHTFGEARALPRDGLARRFGAAFVDALDRARGRRVRSAPAVRAAAALRREARAARAGARRRGARLRREPARARARRLAHRARPRRGRADAHARARAHAGARARFPGHAGPFALGAPARAPAHLLGVLRERLARVALPASVEAIALASEATAPLAGRNLGLLPGDDARPSKCRCSTGCARAWARTR